MKRLLLIVVSLLVSVAMFAQTAAKGEIQCVDQNARMERGTRAASDWGTFTNFVATDMNGVTHNIQNYLDQGKYVAIDFFATWCGPCWNYYNAGVLESLYTTYGQGGTGEFVVLMVEDDNTNTAAQITGTSTSSAPSQGDFTTGGTNPIPIIDATTPLAGHVSLYANTIPSVYLICPSGYAYDIYDNQFGTAQAIYNFATASCPSNSDLPEVEIISPSIAKMGQAATFSSYVVSAAVVTYAWTFEGGTPATATTASVDVVWDTDGPHNVSLVVTNANGSASASTTIDVVDCAGGISEFPFAENFENGQGCWDLISMNTANTETKYGIWEYSSGMHGVVFNSYSGANDYNQYLISPELNHTNSLTLTFKYKKLSSYGTEKFYVKYSTTDTDPSHFTAIGGLVSNATTTWKTHTCVIPADAKYFMIHYCSSYQYWLAIDDITLNVNYTVTAVSDDPDHGTVAGGGVYVNSSNVTLTANPIRGYAFTHWQDNNTDNPRSITVSCDTTFTAYFEALPSYTVTVESDNEEYGTVNGGGTYYAGEVAQISAAPITGYRFVRWQDDNTDNPRNVAVSCDTTFTAYFEALPQYTITVLANNDEYGTVAGGGTYYLGETVQISAEPHEGYLFVKWLDEDTNNPRNISVASDSTFTAVFAVDNAIDENMLNQIAVYPNPTTGIVNIEAEGLTNVVVFDVTGRMMKSVANETTIDISDLEAGVYFFSIETENGSAMRKLVKE